MVPRAEFRSYYGRQILKTPAWEDKIAYYFFAGGLSGGSALLAAGADLTGRPALRRGSRVGGLAALGRRGLLPGRRPRPAGAVPPHAARGQADVADEHGHLAAGGVRTGARAGRGVRAGADALAAVAARAAGPRARPPGRAGRGGARARRRVVRRPCCCPRRRCRPGTRDTPSCRSSSPPARAASAGGLGDDRRAAGRGGAGPAAGHRTAPWSSWPRRAGWSSRLGLVGEAYDTGAAGHVPAARASTLTAAGVLGSVLLGRRSRIAAAACGLALLAGGVFERLGLLHAGIQSAQDPKYVVEPQRRRIAEHGPTRARERSDLADSPAGPSQNLYRSGRSVGGSAARHWAARIDTKAVLP